MTMDCAAFREIAPELALGIAVGDERAAALDHLVGCSTCRRELDGLTATVDAIVATAPSTEPPSGFEVRALGSFDPAPTAPASEARRGRVLALAAGVLVVLALLGAGALALLDDGSSAPSPLAYGTTRDSAPLTAPDGGHVGRVSVERTATADGGPRSELIVTVDAGAPAGDYRVQCDYESGRPYGAGELEVGPDGLARWSTTVGVPTYDLTRVRLVSTTGGDNLEAEFTSG